MSSTHIQAFQAELIDRIKEKGIEHILLWISEVYKGAAAAIIEDEFRNIPEELRGLAALQQMGQLSRSITNKSTGPGQNLMAEARLARLAEIYTQSGLADDHCLELAEARKAGARKTQE